MQFFSPAQCVGYVAFVLGVAAFLQKEDRRLKLLIASESLAYMVHFWLLGNVPASLSAFTSCGRSLLAIKTRSRLLAVFILGLNLTLGVIFAKTPAAWFPVSASCLGTIAVFMLQGIAMRLVLLVCTFLWLANNILSGSIGGTLLETVIAIANISTMIRLFLGSRPGGRETGARRLKAAPQRLPPKLSAPNRTVPLRLPCKAGLLRFL